MRQRFISPVSRRSARWASSLLALVALVDRAHDAVRARGLPSGPANQRPVSSIQTCLAAAAAPESDIAPDRERRRRRRAAAIASRRRTGLRVLGIEELRKARPLAIAARSATPQHRGGVGAPEQARRCRSAIRRRRRRSRRGSAAASGTAAGRSIRCHARPVLGRQVAPGIVSGTDVAPKLRTILK